MTTLEQGMRSRYEANLALIEPFNYASQHGVLYDHEQATRIKEELTPKLWEAQAAVDEAAGLRLPRIIRHCAQNLCFKKKASEVTTLVAAHRFAKKDYCEAIERVQRILKRGKLTPADRGELGSLLETGLNVKSTPAVLATLNRLGLPPIMKRIARATDDDTDSNEPTHRQTKEAAALLAVYLRKPHPILTALLTTIALRGRLQELARKVDDDGRIRSSYTICGPSCLAGDAYIYTRSGWRKIEDIYNHPKPIRVWNGEAFVHPIAKVKYPNEAGCHITTLHGFSLKGSNNHPVMTPHHWKRLDELKVGDLIRLDLDFKQIAGMRVLPRVKVEVTHFNSKKCNLPGHLSNNLAEFIGMWLADGTIHDSGNSYAIRISNQDMEVKERVRYLCKRLFDDEASFIESGAQIHGRAYVEWFKALGIGGWALTKVVPEWIMQGSEQIVRSALRGLTLDAHVKPGKVCYGTQSLEMRRQIQLLLLRLGIVASQSKDRLIIARKYLGQFISLIGFEQSYRTNALVKELGRWNGAVERPDYGFKWVPITSIVPWQGDVFDLTMPETLPHYIANGFYVHNTDRTASRAWLTGSGGNAQTVPREPVNFRVCYLADPVHDWYKLDLTGADLWTVACRVAAEGDRTLLDDLLAGIRIPSLVGLMLEHGYTPTNDRVRVRADCLAYRAELKARGESWRDTVWKKSSHLTNYGGSAKRIRQSVIEDTYTETGTPIDPGIELCERVQRLYLARYWGVRRWWSSVQAQIVRTGKLVYATGRERQFLGARISYGRLDDATCRTAYAAEPQHVTTWVMKEGLNKLWHDLDNWPSGVIGEGTPHIQPTIPCVHDEVNAQALQERRAWAIDKFKSYFTVPIKIGKDSITIPFELCVGPNWGACVKID